METNKLKVGDVVVLKSGGPQMTIKEFDGENPYCVWFAGTELKGSYFGNATVERTVHVGMVAVPHIGEIG